MEAARREGLNHPERAALRAIRTRNGRGECSQALLPAVPGHASDLVDNGGWNRPLSPTSVPVLASPAPDSEQTAAHAVTVGAEFESARVAAIQREYPQMNVETLRHIETMSAADTEDWGQLTFVFTTSRCRPVHSTLPSADLTDARSFGNPEWADGWSSASHKAVNRFINRRSLDPAASLTHGHDEFIAALDSDRGTAETDPKLLGDSGRHPTGHFDST